MGTKEQEICKKIYKMFEQIQRAKYINIRQIFDDFCQLGMSSYHNALYSLGGISVPDFYKKNHDLLEKEYMDIVAKYKEKEAYKIFPEILAELIKAMRESPFDYLGAIYMDMNINSKTHGQFFTPPHICEMMAAMQIGSKESFEEECRRKGYIGVSDPACGSGAMAIGLLKVLKDYEVEDTDIKLYIELVDIDYTCVKMAYLNMAILNLSARVIWGNTLTINYENKFDTPGLQMALAQGRFNRTIETKIEAENEAEPVSAPPVEVKLGQLSLF